MNKKIEIGDVFGRLKVIGVCEKIPHKRLMYICECLNDGNIVNVRGDSLRCGDTKSCGCLKNEQFLINRKYATKKCFINGTNIGKLNSKLQKNNTSGVKGVSWHKKTGKWQARIMFKGKKYSLGYYSDLKEAKQIRDIAEKEIQKDFLKWYKNKKNNNKS